MGEKVRFKSKYNAFTDVVHFIVDSDTSVRLSKGYSQVMKKTNFVSLLHIPFLKGLALVDHNSVSTRNPFISFQFELPNFLYPDGPRQNFLPKYLMTSTYSVKLEYLQIHRAH